MTPIGRILALALVAALCLANAASATVRFDCAVADGPRLTDCVAIDAVLPRDKADLVERAIEETPSCQLKHLTPGGRTTWFAPLPERPEDIDAAWLARPRLSQPDWLQRPDGEAMARLYPRRAARDEVEGKAVISCGVDLRGRAVGCRAVSEEPRGYGFGEAAIQLAQYFRFRPGLSGCELAEGAVRVPIVFRLPKAPPPVRLTPADMGFIAMLGLGIALVALGVAIRMRARKPTATTVPVIVEAGSSISPWPPILLGVVLAAVAVWDLAPLALAALSMAPDPVDIFVGAFVWVLVLALLPVGIVQYRLTELNKRDATGDMISDWMLGRFGFFVLMFWGVWRVDRRLLEDVWLRRVLVPARVGSALFMAFVLTVIAMAVAGD